jgi:hypothetical protein
MPLLIDYDAARVGKAALTHARRIADGRRQSGEARHRKAGRHRDAARIAARAAEKAGAPLDGPARDAARDTAVADAVAAVLDAPYELDLPDAATFATPGGGAKRKRTSTLSPAEQKAAWKLDIDAEFDAMREADRVADAELANAANVRAAVYDMVAAIVADATDRYGLAWCEDSLLRLQASYLSEAAISWAAADGHPECAQERACAESARQQELWAEHDKKRQLLKHAPEIEPAVQTTQRALPSPDTMLRVCLTRHFLQD